MDDYKLRPKLKEFAEIMELQLQENDYRGGWAVCSNDYLISGVLKNLYCITAAMDNGDVREAGLHIADAANFLMMIADNCGLLSSLEVDASCMRGYPLIGETCNISECARNYEGKCLPF